MTIWRRRKPRRPVGRRQPGRLDQRPKDYLHLSTEEQLIERLRRMKLPEPPPHVRERAVQRYMEWLESQGRNRWRE